MDAVQIEEGWKRFEDGTNRTRGPGVVHLTRIIKDLDQRDYGGVSWNMDLTADLGFVWEQALENAYKDLLGIRPGEVEKDGIIGSPDGIGEDPLGLVPFVDEEYKLTWKSSRSKITDNWYYMTQFKGYCYMMETNVVVVRIVYVCGDYKGSGPVYRVWRIEYTDEELKRNWDYLLAHVKNEGWKEEG